MANHNLPGQHPASPGDLESSWRPQDPDRPDEREGEGDDRDEPGGGEPRDARRWESDEDRDPDAPYRGAGAGRYGEDRLRALQDAGRPSAGSFEDRHRSLGGDAGIGWSPDHTGGDPWRHARQDVYRGRDFDPERYELSAVHDPGAGAPQRGGDERIGDPAGSYGRAQAWDTADAAGAAREIHVHPGTGSSRGKGPAGYQRSDERIRERVCESLTDDDAIDASDIEVRVAVGEVTLSGTVDDRRTKRAAEDCAYSVSGVRDVQNRLRVRSDQVSPGNPAGAAAVDLQETQSHAEGRKPRA